MAGEHVDATSRMDYIITDAWVDPALYVVQACERCPYVWWALHEYHASKVVRIYTIDWTPYLGPNVYNHKESPEMVSEMEKETGISARALAALRPGLSDIREKLHLASTRQMTRVEDIAYSLVGTIPMSFKLVSYGEGDKALGRLLSQLLMSSGDTSILVWTGSPDNFNACLPTTIVVFNQPLTS